MLKTLSDLIFARLLNYIFFDLQVWTVDPREFQPPPQIGVRGLFVRRWLVHRSTCVLATLRTPPTHRRRRTTRRDFCTSRPHRRATLKFTGFTGIYDHRTAHTHTRTLISYTHTTTRWIKWRILGFPHVSQSAEPVVYKTNGRSQVYWIRVCLCAFIQVRRICQQWKIQSSPPVRSWKSRAAGDECTLCSSYNLYELPIYKNLWIEYIRKVESIDQQSERGTESMYYT